MNGFDPLDGRYSRTLLEGAERHVAGEQVFFAWALNQRDVSEFEMLILELLAKEIEGAADGEVEIRTPRRLYNIGDTVDLSESFPWLVEQRPEWAGQTGIVVDRRTAPDGSVDYLVDLETVGNAAERILQEASDNP